MKKLIKRWLGIDKIEQNAKDHHEDIGYIIRKISKEEEK